MKACPKCGGLMDDRADKCPHCHTISVLPLPLDKVDSKADTMDLKPAHKARRFFAKMFCALLLATGVFLANWFGTFVWYSVLLAVVGFFTLFFPSLYQRLYFLFFVKGRQREQPTDFYYAVHVVIGLAAWVFAILVPLWKL